MEKRRIIKKRDVKEAVLKAYLQVQKIVSNENRLRILLALNKKPMSWSDLMFTCKVNPKALRDHLELLIESKLVDRASDRLYESTHAGKALIEMSLSNMVETAEFAVKESIKVKR